MKFNNIDVAVFIPCHNEELTVVKVIRDTRTALPLARIYVFDNLSTDRTAELARQAGAVVIASPRPGKGNVVRHAFKILAADVVVMVDGDDTYPMESAPALIDLIITGGNDMAVGNRLGEYTDGAFRGFHVFGNHLLSRTVSSFFGRSIGDMLSGFRAFSREFVEQIPLNSEGFEIETDLTLQAITKGYAIAEMPVSYRHRPAGSVSKLNTYGDGFLILKFIFRLVRDYRPLPFFTTMTLICSVGGAISGWAPVRDYIQYSYVYTVPRAILAASLMLLGAVLFGVGLILDSQNRHFTEQSLMMRMLMRSAKRPAGDEVTSGQRRAL